jgi:hypothetical protein
MTDFFAGMTPVKNSKSTAKEKSSGAAQTTDGLLEEGNSAGTETETSKAETPKAEKPAAKKAERRVESPQKAISNSNVTGKWGRPQEYTEKPKTLKLNLTPDQYTFLKNNGGKYGGMTKYIQHLVDEEMNR